MNLETIQTRPCWFVGATYYDDDNKPQDQTERFVTQGIWVNGHMDKYLDQIKAIQPGDYIAIKSSYTRKYDLPFDNRKNNVSVMTIKAVGIVKENLGDGRNLKVEWTLLNPSREWYFYTNRNTVWQVKPGNWKTDNLLSFTFDGKDQDVNRFRNAPYWRDRFGDTPVDSQQFKWTEFYQAFANGLLTFKDNRTKLVSGLYELANRIKLLPMQDKLDDGSRAPLNDICPFTVIGMFNRGITETNRRMIAQELANFIGVSVPVPDSFEGLPVLNNQRSWFFGYSCNRQPEDINMLWDVFTQAIRFSEKDDEQTRSDFISAYNRASECYGVAWNLSMGLYWIRPWHFATLDSQSRNYIKKGLHLSIGRNGYNKRCNANDYLELVDYLTNEFTEDDFPVHSFPDLSLSAWGFDEEDEEDEENILIENNPHNEEQTIYSIKNIIDEGCFLEEKDLELISNRLHDKKNIILQGPPGTGKTWLAKKIAYAFIGQQNEQQIRAVQFHPNLSYEDFIRGWRPGDEGKLKLVDGPFMEMIQKAKQNSEKKYIFVIEEINRGNPAQILGEMLTLLEADKRTPNDALELSYKTDIYERVYIPENLYIIGTMNIADRSIALVDLALRRRFAFIDLKPAFNNKWNEWVCTTCNFNASELNQVKEVMDALNKEISHDSHLGVQFCIGHSFFTPARHIKDKNIKEWFSEIVKTEIAPILDEYWFDNPEKSKQETQKLLEIF